MRAIFRMTLTKSVGRLVMISLIYRMILMARYGATTPPNGRSEGTSRIPATTAGSASITFGLPSPPALRSQSCVACVPIEGQLSEAWHFWKPDSGAAQ